MNRGEIFLSIHDHMVQVPTLSGTRIVYEFEPEEIFHVIQNLLSKERERCALVCDELAKAYKETDDPLIKCSYMCTDIADIIRRLK